MIGEKAWLNSFLKCFTGCRKFGRSRWNGPGRGWFPWENSRCALGIPEWGKSGGDAGCVDGESGCEDSAWFDGDGLGSGGQKARAFAKRADFFWADQPEETLLPRLVAAGADASQIFFFKGYMVNEVPVEKMLDENASGLRPFRLSRDLGELQWCLEELADEGIVMSG